MDDTYPCEPPNGLRKRMAASPVPSTASITGSGVVIVLGIDAAWTGRRPSGVALIEGRAAVWRLVSVQPSYRHFTEPGWNGPPGGGPPDVDALLGAWSLYSGAEPDLVAVDMPLSRDPIVGRRTSDDAISPRMALAAQAHTLRARSGRVRSPASCATTSNGTPTRSGRNPAKASAA